MADDPVQQRVRVAAVNDYEIIVAGVAHLLERFAGRIEVCDRIVVGEAIATPVDVALYDTYGRVGVAGATLSELALTPQVSYVAMFSMDLRPAIIDAGRAAGASGFISKCLPGDEIADAIVRVGRGEDVIALPRLSGSPSPDLDWPGKDDGLTERQSQVVVLAAEGLTNREIGVALYLSPETVKGYLRQAFARIGVRNRVEAANYVQRSGAFTRFGRAPLTPASN